MTSSARWRRLRPLILRRDDYACVSCGSVGRLEVDHIAPVRDRPDLAFEPTNLQSLCAGCHTRKTRLECGHKEASPDRKAWQALMRCPIS
ncbi:HNH endonuclease [Pseudooctadecabacter jejudonensis]|uniref:HNH endonuclease n=1 Tax=Pseudooctadecabacter jejudonensis TaxID=1391910 RepID=UPI002285863E|nr:HNH endonuclease signature motif containing protein [Pseudooctadecabacter jejudonensis]